MEVALKARRVSAAAGVMALVVWAQPAFCHHSFAMYDQTIDKTLTGKLTRFIPDTNHAQLIFVLANPDGTPLLENGQRVVWGVETGGAASLARSGVTVHSFPVGTIITVTLNPLKDGHNFGAMRPGSAGLISCGMTMPEGGCTAETGTVYLDVARVAGTAESRAQ
ncbi:MAG TPA: DUF6152 family protein [Gammaproteobacteria bacterium]